MRLIFLIIFFLGQSAFAAILNATISPPQNGAASSLYNLPGFTYTNCDKNNLCKKVSFLKKGTIVEVKEAIDIDYEDNKSSTRFYLVEINSPSLQAIGYIEAGYLKLSGAIEKSRLRTIKMATILKSPKSPTVIRMNVYLKEAVPILSDEDVFNPSCQNIMDGEGTTGIWGVRALDALEKVDAKYKAAKGRSCFYNDINMTGVCPNFPKMNLDQKKKFWLYIFSSLSQIETGCNLNTKAPGINGTAAGILQLEYKLKLRTSSARDPEFCITQKEGGGSPNGIMSPSFQFQCSAAIMRDSHCDLDGKCTTQKCIEQRRRLTWGGGYWQKLRGNGEVTKLIKKYPYCSIKK